MNVLRARLVAVGALTAGLLVQPRSLSLQGAEPACEFERVERVVAVGDVHGAYDAFVSILRTAGLIDERRAAGLAAKHILFRPATSSTAVLIHARLSIYWRGFRETRGGLAAPCIR
jgi:hypothetical protein